MNHVNYDSWGNYIVSLCEKHNVDCHKVLELGSGTCQLPQYVSFPDNSSWVFSDLSFAMLDSAASGFPYSRVVADMRALPFSSNFSFIYTMYDSFNYLLSSKEVLDTFNQVSQSLSKEGHFLFDVTTEYNSKYWFADDESIEEFQDCDIARQSYYDEEHRLQHNDFIFYEKVENGLYRKVTENHCQRIYLLDELLKLVKKSPLKLVAVYSDFTFSKPKKNAERLQILLRKEL